MESASIKSVDFLGEREFFDLLNTACGVAGSQKAFAEQCGVSAQYLHSVLHAKQAPSPAILGAIGLRRVTFYQRIGAEA